MRLGAMFARLKSLNAFYVAVHKKALAPACGFCYCATQHRMELSNGTQDYDIRARQAPRAARDAARATTQADSRNDGCGLG